MANPPSGTALPEFNSRLVTEDDTVSIPWSRFFIALWQKTGGSIVTVAGTTLIQQVGNLFELFGVSGGTSLTYLATLLTPKSFGAAVQVQTLAASPFTYTATVGGTLVVFSGQVELSRDSGANWYMVGLTGGAIPMLNGDRVRVTWFESGVANRPTVTFFPMANGP
jgi:hypothetical protein